MKEILGAIAVVLFLIGYAVYFRGMILSRVRPHFFTWLIWVISVTVIFAAQIADGAGPGAWTTCLSIAFCSIVAIYAWFRGEKKFTRGDWISLILALGAVPIWYFTHQPAYAAIISTGIDCVAYYPTFRKSYWKPQEENLTTYGLDGLRHLISFLALSHITLATASYPVALCIISFAFVLFALWRRRICRAKIA
jgi:hypothetical protein